MGPSLVHKDCSYENIPENSCKVTGSSAERAGRTGEEADCDAYDEDTKEEVREARCDFCNQASELTEAGSQLFSSGDAGSYKTEGLERPPLIPHKSQDSNQMSRV